MMIKKKNKILKVTNMEGVKIRFKRVWLVIKNINIKEGM